MTVVLPRKLEALIEELVASGAYDSPEQVVAKAMKLLERHENARQEHGEKLQWLRGAWIEGQQSGDGAELDLEAFLARMDGELRKKQAE